MRRRKTFVINRGVISGQGATKSEAKADLDKQIDWAIGGSELHVENRFGWMIVITRDPNGWSSLLVDLQNTKHGEIRGASGLQGPNEFKSVLQSARMHAAQNAWRSDTIDSEHVVLADLDAHHSRELADWINWQRRYQTAKLAGKTDNEAHHIASGLMAA